MAASNGDGNKTRETGPTTSNRETSSEGAAGGAAGKKSRSRRRRSRRRKPDGKGAGSDNKEQGARIESRERGGSQGGGRKSDGVPRGRRRSKDSKKDGEESGPEDRKSAERSERGTLGRRRGRRGTGRAEEKGRRGLKGRRQDGAFKQDREVPDRESGFFLPAEDMPADEEGLTDALMNVSDRGGQAILGGDDAPECVWKRECVFNVSHVDVQGELATEEADCGDIFLQRGDHIVVETDRGQAMAKVLTPSIRKVLVDPRLRSVLRRFDAGDMRQDARNRRRAREAYAVGKDRIASRKIKMKLVGVDYLHSGNKAVFYFTADGRVDFRELIRDLARNLRVRIEMRQIGIRDEARLVGGMGTCGRELCCNTFLEKFDQISIRMAKDQKIVLNPQKISGQCGRLKCCLVYEHHIYREMGRFLPKVGKRIETPKGEGRIMDVDVLTRRIRVNLEDGAMEVFSAEELGFPSTGAAFDSEDETRGDN